MHPTAGSPLPLWSFPDLTIDQNNLGNHECVASCAQWLQSRYGAVQWAGYKTAHISLFSRSGRKPRSARPCRVASRGATAPTLSSAGRKRQGPAPRCRCQAPAQVTFGKSQPILKSIHLRLWVLAGCWPWGLAGYAGMPPLIAASDTVDLLWWYCTVVFFTWADRQTGRSTAHLGCLQISFITSARHPASPAWMMHGVEGHRNKVAEVAVRLVHCPGCVCMCV